MARLILGHTTHESIKIWVRSEARWPVAFIDVLDSADRKTSATCSIELEADDFYTGVVEWTGLKPGRPYVVKVSFGKSKKDPQDARVREAYTEGSFTTFSNPTKKANFSFLFGSCNLHSLGVIKNPDKVWLKISELARRNNASFMIHCGDQIYADIPFRPSADPGHYRDKYLDAWEDCRSMQKYLTELPHYMILDDHEITNNFHRDMDNNDDDYESLMRAALKGYYEFQHKHNPDTPLSPRQYHYEFNYGKASFFVMDTRFWRDQSLGQMVDQRQLDRFLEWLLENKNNIKFVVTSVPFVAEVRRPKRDKWCDPTYKKQRDMIIECLEENSIGKLVFLAGDMHNSYHAKMTLKKGSKKIEVHELMSSPLNQFTPDVEVDDVYISPSSDATKNGVKYESKITEGKFYGRHSNVMAVEVSGATVNYRIYRTRKDGPIAKRGSFKL